MPVGVSILAALGLSLLIFFVHRYFAASQSTMRSALFYILPYLANGMTVLVTASALLLAINRTSRNSFVPSFSVVLSAAAGYFFLKDLIAGPLLVLAVVFTPVVLLLAITYAKLMDRFPSARITTVAYTAAHFSWVAVILSMLFRSDQTAAVAYLFGFKSILFWFWVFSRKRQGTLSVIDIAHPMNALRGWPWPKSAIDDDMTAGRRTWWNGYFNVLLGYSLFALVGGLIVHFESSYSNLFFNYLVHVLVDVGTLNVIAGGARLFGFNFPDATYFSFFAKSPGELWRRGSVYNFKFNQEFVFWPAIRFFKSYYPALFIAFSMFYLNSLTFESMLTLSGSRANTNQLQFHLESGRAIVFSLHFLLICLPGKIWSFRRFELSDAHRQWLSVIATHVCSLVILFLAYVVFNRLLTLH